MTNIMEALQAGEGQTRVVVILLKGASMAALTTEIALKRRGQ